MPASTFEDILKFNPYHDAKGRFAAANSATSFTYSPGKSKAHDKAIAREKERQAAATSTGKYTKEEQISAIADWSDGGYAKIRRAQRGESDDETRKAQAEAIEEFIEQAPAYTGDLYRGISTEKPVNFKVGQEISMNGVSSWSKSEDIADEFSRFDDYSTCFVTKGLTRAADVSMHTMNPGEEEVLVSVKTNFKVTQVEFDPDLDQTIVVVEEIRG